MPYKISCPFFISSSHEIHTIGFRGENFVKLTTPLKFEDPLGLLETTLVINQLSEERYLFEVISQTLATHDKQVNFLKNISEYLSFLMARGESNPHYGTAFIEPMWIDFKSDYIPDNPNQLQDQLKITDTLAIKSTRTVNLYEKDLPGATHTDLLRFYVDGLRAEHKKSKYFHWFLILEYLEHSKIYQTLFGKNKLFNEAEAKIIKDIAEKLDGQKKSVILDTLSRTKEPRNYKLMTMLHYLSITSIKTFGETTEVNEKMIKGITAGRNALFHSGSKISDGILWRNLFPLATYVVERVSCSPTCLDN